MTGRARRVAAVILVATALPACGGDAPGEGPLLGDTGIGQTQPIPIREPYAFGSIMLSNLGKEPITVERVRLLKTSGPLELLEVRSRPVPDEQGEGPWYGDGTFPAALDEPTKPLAEQNQVPVPTSFSASDAPDQGLQLVFHLRLPEVAIGVSRLIEITYRADDKEYEETFEYSMVVCGEATPDKTKRCPFARDLPVGDGTLETSATSPPASKIS